MNEKKTNVLPEEKPLPDETLDKATGGNGYTHEPLNYCSKCGSERKWQGNRLVCPQCDL